jgi:transmembrane anterior posterior transformation protein 1
MGFIPFPLAVVLVKALYHSLSFKNLGSIVILVIAYLCLFSCRVLNTICTLGKACDIMQKHQDEKIAEKMASQAALTSHPASIIKSKPQQISPVISEGSSPIHQKISTVPSQSPIISSSTVPNIVRVFPKNQAFSTSSISSEENNLKINSSLGATVIFSNSDVELDDIGMLNSKAIEQVVEEKIHSMDESLIRHGSEPDLVNLPGESSSDEEDLQPYLHRRRSHKRSESEPFIQLDSTSDRL